MLGLNPKLGAEALSKEKIRPLALAMAEAPRKALQELQQDGLIMDVSNHRPDQVLLLRERANKLTREAAVSVLSQNQLRAFDEMQARELSMVEATLNTRRAGEEPPGPAARQR